jgi:hypothetical protein
MQSPTPPTPSFTTETAQRLLDRLGPYHPRLQLVCGAAAGRQLTQLGHDHLLDLLMAERAGELA